MNKEEENALVQTVLNGNREEFVVVVRQFQAEIYALVRRQVGDASTAEDLCQEVFLRAYAALGSFRGESSLRTWLIRIALNQCNNYFSSKRYKQSRISEPFSPIRHDATDPREGPAAALEYELHVEQLRSALAKLKPTFREVLVLCGLQGRSYEEVAELLQIPVGTVRSRLNKARLLIKDSLLAAAAKEGA